MRLTTLAAALSVFVVASADAKTVLITGSNSGIGLEFAKQYASKGWDVIATHRRSAAPESLSALHGQYPNLIHIETMDVTNHEQIDALATKLEGTAIDVLISNAGITGDFRNPAPQSFGTLDYDQWENFMRINALGGLKVAEAFVNHVKASEDKTIVSISSLAGTFGFKGPTMPGGYWYKSSKATLNMYVKVIASDLKKDGVIIASLSPGQVKVEKMGDVSFPGLIEPQESISGMISVIEGLTLEDSGTLFSYDGSQHPF
ncbi:MAG: SDR family oxidoreductase [Rhodospirillaceae bacterium]|nr:SDR family oxidoreductase [Rhodospirillaceae bacterium]MBT5240043.1 SDR family oxidoreductase [Rhodospirillaceae bacterium]MBT5566396.1 SDR family oxidoreductase [Rhodospirillaceae bacterium]MBT7450862.1 SDR family oxidoreductase [Rhodospirillaceae bacterium]